MENSFEKEESGVFEFSIIRHFEKNRDRLIKKANESELMSVIKDIDDVNLGVKKAMALDELKTSLTNKKAKLPEKNPAQIEALKKLVSSLEEEQNDIEKAF